MRIKEILSQHRRDFDAIYECEHCGSQKRTHGYDDANFHQNVVPKMKCPYCGLTAGENYRPLKPKYPEGTTV